MRCIIRAAMDIPLEPVLAILREIFDEMEDLWSEAETYKAMLVVRGLTDQELATSAMNSRQPQSVERQPRKTMQKDARGLRMR